MEKKKYLFFLFLERMPQGGHCKSGEWAREWDRAHAREWYDRSLIPWHIASPCLQISVWDTHLVHTSCKEINLRRKERDRESDDGVTTLGIRVWWWCSEVYHTPVYTRLTVLDQLSSLFWFLHDIYLYIYLLYLSTYPPIFLCVCVGVFVYDHPPLLTRRTSPPLFLLLP